MRRTTLGLAFLVLISGCAADAAPEDPTSAVSEALAATGHPDPAKTPGALCTPADPNFDGVRYPSKIAHCARHVTPAQKAAVAAAYGIAPADYAKYEFDHYLPLAIGGSNDTTNLWPQPLALAKQKDVVEQNAYLALRAGTITQGQAVAMIVAWQPAAQ